MDRLLHTRLREGDLVRLKKTHPCGSAEWEVLRLGADVKLRCRGCGRRVQLPRSRLAGGLREILSGGGEPPG